MIIGIGTDLCVIERFEAMLGRNPGIAERLLCDGERALALPSQAARFAAKEALAKALGSPGGMRWLDSEVVTDEHGKPSFIVRGTVKARAEELGVKDIHLSISHDGGFTTAMVVCEG